MALQSTIHNHYDIYSLFDVQILRSTYRQSKWDLAINSKEIVILRTSTLWQREIRVGFYTVRLSLVAQLGENQQCRRPRFNSTVGKSGIGYPLQYSWVSLVAQLVKIPPAMWETWVKFLSWEDPPKQGMATHSSILAWRIPWTGWYIGLQRVRHDWATHFTSLLHHHLWKWRRVPGPGILAHFWWTSFHLSQYSSPHWKYVESHIMLFTSVCAPLHWNLRLLGHLLLQKLTHLKWPFNIKWKESVSHWVVSNIL